MKIGLIVLSLIIILSIVGCDASNPAVVDDSPPIDVNAQLYDDAGVAHGLDFINGFPRVSTTDYLYSIAEGIIPGHNHWSKHGYTPASTATQSTLWDVGTEYVWPVAEQQMEVVSSSINDDVGSTGVTSVKISYLTSTGVEKTETVTMDGTTVVPTAASDIYRVNFFTAASVGASGVAAGNITIRNLANSPVYSQISAGYTRSRSAVYTVPDTKTLYITSVALSAAYKTAGKTVRLTLQATYDHIANTALGANFFMPYSEVMLMDCAYQKEFEIPIVFPELTDIKVSFIGETLAQCTVALRGWEE